MKNPSSSENSEYLRRMELLLSNFYDGGNEAFYFIVFWLFVSEWQRQSGVLP